MRSKAAYLGVAIAAAAVAVLLEGRALGETKLVPGQWVAFAAPPVRGRPSNKLTVFVPERKPEPGERIPALDRKAVASLPCSGTWQLRFPLKPGPRGSWGPSPSGDDRWVWHPKKAPTTAVEPHVVPDATPDYGDEFAFCAKAPGEPFSMKDAPGKIVPGSWVTLVDGKRTTTVFVANTAVAEGDVLPAIPTQEKRIDCTSKLHPTKPKTKPPPPTTRPTAPYGRWVPDPFGSKRWAWLPTSAAPFALRPTASPPEVPPRSRRVCSWFEDAD